MKRFLNRKPPIVTAILENNIDLLEQLKEKPNIVNKSYNFSTNKKEKDIPLIYAVKNNEIGIIKELLTFPDIKVDLQDKHGNTALIYAVKNDKTKIVEELLKFRDIDVSIKPKFGQAALYYAVINNKDEIVEKLFDHPTIDKQLVFHALIHSLKNDKDDLVELIVKKFKHTDAVNMGDNLGSNPLIIAIEENKTNIVEKLLEFEKIDVNNKDKNGNTALIVAVKKDNQDIIKLLLSDPRIDVNNKDNNGNTVFIVAVKKDNQDIIKLLLSDPRIDVNTSLISVIKPLYDIKKENYSIKLLYTTLTEEINFKLLDKLLVIMKNKNIKIEVSPEIKQSIKDIRDFCIKKLNETEINTELINKLTTVMSMLSKIEIMYGILPEYNESAPIKNSNSTPPPNYSTPSYAIKKPSGSPLSLPPIYNSNSKKKSNSSNSSNSIDLGMFEPRTRASTVIHVGGYKKKSDRKTKRNKKTKTNKKTKSSHRK